MIGSLADALCQDFAKFLKISMRSVGNNVLSGHCRWATSNHNLPTSKVNEGEDVKEGMVIVNLEVILGVEMESFRAVDMSRIARDGL